MGFFGIVTMGITLPLPSGVGIGGGGRLPPVAFSFRTTPRVLAEFRIRAGSTTSRVCSLHLPPQVVAKAPHRSLKDLRESRDLLE